jgi:hypothetical protein
MMFGRIAMLTYHRGSSYSKYLGKHILADESSFYLSPQDTQQY